MKNSGLKFNINRQAFNKAHGLIVIAIAAVAGLEAVRWHDQSALHTITCETVQILDVPAPQPSLKTTNDAYAGEQADLTGSTAIQPPSTEIIIKTDKGKMILADERLLPRLTRGGQNLKIEEVHGHLIKDKKIIALGCTP